MHHIASFAGITPSIFYTTGLFEPKLNEKLAQWFSKPLTKKPIDDKLKILAEEYSSPENCDFLIVPRVNRLPEQRGNSRRLQEVQKSIIHAAQNILVASEAIIQNRKKKANLDLNVLSEKI